MHISKIVLLVVPAFLAGACGGGGSGERDAEFTVSVSPVSPNLVVGDTVEMFATVRSSSGQVLTGKTVAWRSENTAVLTITNSGVATAVGEGSTRAIATVETREGSTTVAVSLPAPVPGPVSRIDIDPVSVTVQEGLDRQFSAIIYDADGKVVDGKAIAWTSDDAGIVFMRPGGLATGIRVGATTIRARVEGVSASAAIRVEADWSHDLIFSRSVAAGALELAILDINDPAAVALPVFNDGTLAYDPVVSPDGSRLVFVVPTPAGSAIYTASREGTGKRALIEDGAANDQPSWSPDGARIAFRRREQGAGTDIWVMNAETGGDRLNLTADLGDTGQNSPAWSPLLPGGISRIAYSHSEGGLGHLWTMSPDGSDKRQVTSSSSAYDDEPAWSPDGAHLVFQRSDAAIFGDLYVVSSSGGDGGLLMIFIGGLPGPQFAPAWSPDGNLIAFTSRHETDTYQVYTVWRDGTRVARRTFDQAAHTYPAWISRPIG